MRFWNQCPIKRPNKIVELGWLIDTQSPSFIWEEPTLFEISKREGASIKAVQKCPALLNYESQIVVIPCPFDLHIRLHFDQKTKALKLENVLGSESPIAHHKLGELLNPIPIDRWKDPNKPIIQIPTAYRFVTDEIGYLSQLPPFLHYSSHAWPGILIAGRFPLYAWPRILMWAFEWHDTKKDLILKRGDPWFYVRFEGSDPSQIFKLVEAERTPELQEYCQGMDGVTNYVKQTFSLFKIAESRRPKQLLKVKQRD
jgi:hypothetical protein